MVEFLPSKQGVAGSSPVSRSTGFRIGQAVVRRLPKIIGTPWLSFEVLNSVFGTFLLSRLPLVISRDLFVNGHATST